MSENKFISNDMKKKIQSFDDYKKTIKNFSFSEAKAFLKNVGALTCRVSLEGHYYR